MARAKVLDFSPGDPGFDGYEVAKRCAVAVELLRERTQHDVAAIALLREGLLFALQAYRIQNRLASDTDSKVVLDAALNGLLDPPIRDELSSSEMVEVGHCIDANARHDGIPTARGDRQTLARALTTVLDRLLDEFERRETAVQRVWMRRLTRWFVTISVVVGLFYGAFSCSHRRNEHSIWKSSDSGSRSIGLRHYPAYPSSPLASRYS